MSISTILPARAADLDARMRRARVAVEHDVRIEDRDQPVEIAVVRRREEGVDDASLSLRIGVRHRVPRLNPAAPAARELASGIGRALDDGRDLLEVSLTCQRSLICVFAPPCCVGPFGSPSLMA